MRSSSSCGRVSTPPLTSAILGLDLFADLVDAGLVDQDLDARLVLVVAAAVAVVDAQDALEIGEQMLVLARTAGSAWRSSACGPGRRRPRPPSRSRPRAFIAACRPISWKLDGRAVMTAPPLMAILNLRGR